MINNINRFRSIVTRVARVHRTVNFAYLTPIQKPVMSLSLNAIMELTAQCLQYSHDQFAIMAQISVVLGAFGFRLGLQFLGLFFQSLSLRKKDTWVHQWIHNIFLVDLQRDAVFYELTPQKARQLAQYYTPQKLFTSFLKGYTLLNFFRGCYYLTTNPNFQSFCTNNFGCLALYDPIFILPIPIIIINYLILCGSRHPFLIHLVRKQNKMMCFTIAFMSGLLFIPTASVYPLAYMGLGMAHLMLRSARYRVTDWSTSLLAIWLKITNKR